MNNLTTNLEESGLSIGFRFLKDTAGFPISEGIPYEPTDANGYAFLVGVVNTVRVAVIGIILATIIGTFVGIARLSGNWLVRKLASLYVETVRNIPLLVQLFFWYFAVMLTALPLVQDAIRLPGPIYLSRRGLYLPWPQMTAAFGTWSWFLLGGGGLAVAIYLLRRMQLRRADRPGFPLGWALLALLATAVAGWFLAPGNPLVLDVPVLKRFNFEGGMWLSTSFSALVIGLATYTGAFIAEIVRAGIVAVGKPQNEAAKALGLRRSLVLRLVVLPQALRVIIPPLTSQYLNLTKNSSLAILIGYYDLVNVGTTIFNQTGRAVEMILLIMGSYLTMSLLTSLMMNWYNRRIRLVER
ncbi:MAG: ABC transporter permease subunit [Candidatus Bipolaricaulota bacterium]|nr:MAG: ABC transporter permease subunit [Candidatus Bipolaricaulota bacterium]